MPVDASPSARSLVLFDRTPSGELPSRSVGPEPGSISTTGASAGPASINVPASGPAGPGACTSVATGGAAAIRSVARAAIIGNDPLCGRPGAGVRKRFVMPAGLRSARLRSTAPSAHRGGGFAREQRMGGRQRREDKSSDSPKPLAICLAHRQRCRTAEPGSALGRPSRLRPCRSRTCYGQ